MKRSHRAYQRQLHTDLDGAQGLHVFRWLVVVVLALGGALCYVRLRSCTEQNWNTVAQLKGAYEVRQRELENLEVQQEGLTNGRHIREAVERMRLGLKPPSQGQVRRMTVQASPATPKSTQLVVGKLD